MSSRSARPSIYRGRFAPSPTGPLHLGSLVAAVGSFLCARAVDGEWHVRIDDLDTSRVVPGAAEDILRTLEIYGFEWHGPVVRQSQRHALYFAALDDLLSTGAAFECTCSRRELALLHASSEQAEDLRYPGRCRTGVLAPERDRAVRFRVSAGVVSFYDRFQGPVETNVEAEVGDFVIRRRDGLFAYQLACAVDDVEQRFTEVVRGADLLGSTARQMLIHRALRTSTPQYGHLPVVLNVTGKKLSKSAGAAAAEPQAVVPNLRRVLDWLGQRPPPDLAFASIAEVWQWASQHWQAENVPKVLSLTEN